MTQPATRARKQFSNSAIPANQTAKHSLAISPVQIERDIFQYKSRISKRQQRRLLYVYLQNAVVVEGLCIVPALASIDFTPVQIYTREREVYARSLTYIHTHSHVLPFCEDLRAQTLLNPREVKVYSGRSACVYVCVCERERYGRSGKEREREREKLWGTARLSKSFSWLVSWELTDYCVCAERDVSGLRREFFL